MAATVVATDRRSSASASRAAHSWSSNGNTLVRRSAAATPYSLTRLVSCGTLVMTSWLVLNII